MAQPSVKAPAGQSLEVPRIPYWLPGIGNLTQLLSAMDGFLNKLRDTYDEGLVRLNLLGTTHNLVLKPNIATRIFAQRPAAFDKQYVTRYFLHVVGGTPSKYTEQVLANMHAFESPLNTLLREPHLSKISSIMVRNLERTLPNLLSFSDRPMNQHPWEQRANIERKTDPSCDRSIELSLLPLLLDYTAHVANPSIFGTDLLRLYPHLLSSLWDFNTGFFLLASYLPRWLPLPALSSAYAGRDRVIEALTAQQRALDAEAAGGDVGEWENLGDVSEVIRGRNKAYRERGIPAEGRVELSLLWALNANSNFAVFWLLLRVVSTEGLLGVVREEVAPFVRVERERDGFGLVEPRVGIDEGGLLKNCPLLKACFVESMRLDSSTWSLQRLARDVDLEVEAGGRAYRLRKGEFIDIPTDSYTRDPGVFAEPEVFRPERHLRSVDTDENGKQKAEWGTVRPFGGGATMCKGRAFAEREVLTMVAGLLTLWDVEPADETGQWRLPKRKKATGVHMPVEDVCVRVRRREVVAGG